MQLSSSLMAGLGGGALPPPEMMKALQYNPLLYYSYYAQMLSALQAQQKLLEMNSAAPPPPPASNNNVNNNNSIKDLLSPLKMASNLGTLKDNNQVRVLPDRLETAAHWSNSVSTRQQTAWLCTALQVSV